MRATILRDDLTALAGLAMPLAWLAAHDGWLLPRLVACVGLVLCWQVVFALARGQGLALHGLVSGLLIAILVPPEAPFWQLVIGISFGMVLGEAIFGGRGRNFVQPVVLVLACLALSFTDQPWRDPPQMPLAAALPALVLLVLSGQARVTVLLGLAAGIAVAALVIDPGLLAPSPVAGALLLALVYLSADPVTSGATDAGRVICGLLTGGLAVLFTTAGGPLGAVVFATLLAQVFAPLFDSMVVALHVRLMRRRAARLRNG